jgi:hypothetical protein
VFQEECSAEAGQSVRGDILAKNVVSPAGAFGGGGDEDARVAGGAGGEAEAIGRKRRDAGGEFLLGVGAGLGVREGEGWRLGDAEGP